MLPVVATQPRHVKMVKTALEKAGFISKQKRIGPYPPDKALRAIPVEPIFCHCARDPEQLVDHLGVTVGKLFANGEARLDESVLGDELPHALLRGSKGSKGSRGSKRKNLKNLFVANLEVTAKEFNVDMQAFAVQDMLLSLPNIFFLRPKDVLMLPPKALRGPGWDGLGTLKACAFEAVARTAGAGVRRIIRDAEIDGGKKRQSRAVLLYDPDGLGDWVEVKENGIFYGYPATKVMFCKGNGTEKQRLGGPSVDCTGDVVADLFAGIGYFTLPFLVLGNAAHVFACDINPDSVAALRSNVARNGVSSRCTIYQGDNREVARKHFAGKADRVNLGLIPSSEASYEAAVLCLKHETGGMLHIHGNARSVDRQSWAESVPGRARDCPSCASCDMGGHPCQCCEGEILCAQG